MDKVIFVGDKPSNRMKLGSAPFSGAICEKRLKEWIIIINPKEYHVVNRGDLECAAWVTLYLIIPLKFIALGNNASNTLKKYDVEHFKLPHPSGLNRQINDKDFIKNRLEAATAYIRDLE